MTVSLPKLTPTTNDKVAAGQPLSPWPLNPALQGSVQSVPVDPAPQPLKIALIGTAPSSRNLAPYNDPTWKIWACSAGNQGQVPRVDAWFEIHASLLWPEHESYGRPYVEWLKQQIFPIYAQDNSLIPNAIPLPRKELIDEFGPYFFTSSFSWMMAMAMREGAKEIALYGIDMASRDEYVLQRQGAYFFFLEAKRRGIKVTAPHESDIMQPPPLYGFAEATPLGRKMYVREKELKDRIAGMKQQHGQLEKSITYLEGALEDIDYFRSIWSGVQEPK